MSRKKRTFEDYERIGEKFKKIERALIDLEIDVANTFTKAICNKMGPAEKALSKVKSELDDKIFVEFPEKDGQELYDVFYGNSDEKYKPKW